MRNNPDIWREILNMSPNDSVIAGGCVRDYLLGIEPKDIDLFISADTSLRTMVGENRDPWWNPDPNALERPHGYGDNGFRVYDLLYTPEHPQHEEDVIKVNLIVRHDIDLRDQARVRGVKLIRTFDLGFTRFFYTRDRGIEGSVVARRDLDTNQVTLLQDTRAKSFERFSTWYWRRDNQDIRHRFIFNSNGFEVHQPVGA